MGTRAMDASLEQLQELEQEDDERVCRPTCDGPSMEDRHDELLREQIRGALMELPIHLAALAYALASPEMSTDLSRELGQPFSETVRQVASIREHLADKGLG